jgi:uncharacterized protein
MDNQVILNTLKEALIARFGNIIERIILFGSRADGTARDYSDYDILIITSSIFDWQREREIYDVCYDIDLKFDILIDAKVISLEDMKSIKGRQPYIQNAVETGMVA